MRLCKGRRVRGKVGRRVRVCKEGGGERRRMRCGRTCY